MFDLPWLTGSVTQLGHKYLLRLYESEPEIAIKKVKAQVQHIFGLQAGMWLDAMLILRDI